MEKTAERILNETAPRRVADLVVKLDREESLLVIEAKLPGALAGDREQVRAYVDAYTNLTDRVLEAVEGATAARATSLPWIRTMLRGEAMNAPFSQWVGSLDVGPGTAVAIVEILRSTLPTGKRVSPPKPRKLPGWNLGETEVVRFYREVAAALEGAEAPLGRIRDVLALNRTEAASLFEVRRQALEGWERNGVPSDRQAKLATIGAIVDLLSVQLKADRIAAVARRPAAAYGDRSILEAIGAGDEERVLDQLRAGFDWASGA